MSIDLPRGVRLWWADLRAADIATAATLPAAERARLDELSDQAARGRRLVGALLLQEAVRTVRGAPPDSVVEVSRTCDGCGAQHGRPVVADGRGPHLSLAHAGLLVVVATCMGAPVGVDVERADRFASPAECAAWVESEARFKAGPGAAEGVPLRVETPMPGYCTALVVAPVMSINSARSADGPPLGPG
ncbi:4'-phosphopantetheinyl transferase family protein [Aestuariimicrobium sp. Y1814]|uniref:4'-phosphopantetheinyl transferase family protein n=1 Tax=Aestuariimicrobium sp. Y1814 TaxID=3418742 RepID=UPI003DA7816E